ncbi:MAG: formate dehydrogenase accessory sulfurtransferase FdhD [Terriglobia bacterium]
MDYVSFQQTRSARLVEWQSGEVRRFQDDLVAEEPLQICLGELPLTVTLRTPGHDLELAAGFLFTEGIIRTREQILSLKHCRQTSQGLVEIGGRDEPGGSSDEASGNVVRVELAAGAVPGIERIRRNFVATASCGICGKASIESVRVRGIRTPNPDFRIAPEILIQLAEKMRSAQAVFARTGALHAAALFDARGELIVLREDIGRHNAVDQVVGWAVLEGGIPLSQYAMMVSGRGGFEIVQKAAVAGTPVVASVSAPSSLAVTLARELNLTLAGFLRGSRFLVYSGVERLGLTGAVEP